MIAIVAAAIFAAGLLSACGDSDSTSSSSTSTTTPAQQSGEDSGGQSGSKDSQGGASQTGKSSDGGSGSKGSGSEAVATPLKVSGGGSAQFRAKGGDNSIQEYGEETDESELQQAAEAVHGFYVARAEEDWAKACTYLAESMVEQLEQLVDQASQLKAKGCAAILQAFTRPTSASVRRDSTVVDAGSLRREDERGFLIYYDSAEQPYAMPLADEDGTWKLTLLSATPLG